MKAEELRTKTADQLNTDLAGLKKEAFNLRFQQANGQLENTARVRAVRRDIARIMTFLSRQAASAVEAAPKAEKKAAAPKAAKPKAAKKTAKPKSAAEPKAKTATPKAKAAAKKAAKAKA